MRLLDWLVHYNPIAMWFFRRKYPYMTLEEHNEGVAKYRASFAASGSGSWHRSALPDHDGSSAIVAPDVP